MKRVLFIGLSFVLFVVLSLSVFAIDNSYTQLDFVPIDYADITVQDSSSPLHGTIFTLRNNGLNLLISNSSGFIPQLFYHVKAFSDSSYLFRANGMSLYVLCIDMRLIFTDGSPSGSYPIPRSVAIRFLDDNGDPISNFINNVSESADHFTKYFTFVLRETEDLDIYGVEAAFQYATDSNSSLPNPSVMNSFEFFNFGWRYSTGVEEVQTAILSGVDVLVYGDETLRRLQAAGYESFEDFVSYEEIFLGYVHSNFDEHFFENLPSLTNFANGFSFLQWMGLHFVNDSYMPGLYTLIQIAIAVGLSGALFGLAAGVFSRARSDHHNSRRE